MTRNPSTSSWRKFPIQQQPDYPDKVHLEHVESQLCALPPLVFAQEIRDLKQQLADVGHGKGFLSHPCCFVNQLVASCDFDD